MDPRRDQRTPKQHQRQPPRPPPRSGACAEGTGRPVSSFPKPASLSAWGGRSEGEMDALRAGRTEDAQPNAPLKKTKQDGVFTKEKETMRQQRWPTEGAKETPTPNGWAQ